MRIRYLCPFGIRTGYAQAAQDYISALVLAGAEVDIVPLNDGNADSLDGRYHHLIPLVNQDLEDVEIHLVHTIPGLAHLFAEGDYHPGPGVKRVCLTTWETNTLPAEFARNLDRAFDAIVVPCWYNQRAFYRAGIPREKILVIPHTYDPDFWKPADDRRWDIQRPLTHLPGENFTKSRFYTIGVWGTRKNLAGTILAYWHAFCDGTQDVELKVLCPEPPEGEIEALFERAALPNVPPTEFITKPLGELELRQFHLDNDVFVSATRGEAWGLGAFEAALTGNLIIMPRQGGQADYLDDARLMEVPYTMTPVLPELHTARSVNLGGVRLHTVAKAAPTGIDASHLWAEPDLLEMAMTMRRYHSGWPTSDSSPSQLSRYSYEGVGRTFHSALQRLKEG